MSTRIQPREELEIENENKPPIKEPVPSEPNPSPSDVFEIPTSVVVEEANKYLINSISLLHQCIGQAAMNAYGRADLVSATIDNDVLAHLIAIRQMMPDVFKDAEAYIPTLIPLIHDALMERHEALLAQSASEHVSAHTRQNSPDQTTGQSPTQPGEAPTPLNTTGLR